MRTWVLVLSGVVVCARRCWATTRSRSSTSRQTPSKSRARSSSSSTGTRTRGSTSWARKRSAGRRPTPPSGPASRGSSATASPSARCAPATSSASGRAQPQPERQPHPPQAHRAAVRWLEVGRAGRPEQRRRLRRHSRREPLSQNNRSRCISHRTLLSPSKRHRSARVGCRCLVRPSGPEPRECDRTSVRVRGPD